MVKLTEAQTVSIRCVQLQVGFGEEGTPVSEKNSICSVATIQEF